MTTATIDRPQNSTFGGLRVDGQIAPSEEMTKLEPVSQDAILPSYVEAPRRSTASDHLGKGTDVPQHVSYEISPLVRLNSRSPTRKFNVQQRWEGVVTSVDDDSFCAEIVDLTQPKHPMEVVEVGFEDIAVSDRRLIGPGAIFYWCIGLESATGGQIRRVSEIRFRRTPRWSQRDVERINLRATAIEDWLNATQTGSPAS